MTFLYFESTYPTGDLRRIFDHNHHSEYLIAFPNRVLSRTYDPSTPKRDYMNEAFHQIH